MITMEYKLSLIQKALSNPDYSVRELARDNNVGYSSLLRWLQLHRENKLFSTLPKESRRHQDWSRSERLEAVLDCASLKDEALGSYCREQGLYPAQLTEWKTQLMKENPSALTNEHKQKLQALEAENKLLKKELRRKDRALAEASALLILKKKVDLIWGDAEDD